MSKSGKVSRMGYDIKTVNTVRERRFQPAPRPSLWADVVDRDWNNWIWQQQKRIKTMEQLEKVIHPTSDEREAFAQSHEMFNLGITPYYARVS